MDVLKKTILNSGYTLKIQDFTPGRTGTLLIEQDETGGHILNLPSELKYRGSVALNTEPNGLSLLKYVVDDEGVLFTVSYPLAASGSTGSAGDYYDKLQSDARYYPKFSNPNNYLTSVSWGEVSGKPTLFDGDFYSLANYPTKLSDFFNDLSGSWMTKVEADTYYQPLEDQRLSTDRDVRFNSITSTSYTSGSFGTGFRIDGFGNAEFENLSVRNVFNVNELKVNKVTASNGSIAVTDGIKIFTVTEESFGYVCQIESGSGTIAVPFAVDDLVRCQVYNGTGVKYYLRKVTAVTTDSFTLALTAIAGTDTPEPLDEVVRFGNTSDTNRQGLLYLTSSDSNAPYMDVLDGVTSADLSGKTKVRLGKLDGITDANFGALSGYGLYAENAYLKGTINVTGGNAQTITGSQAQADAAQAAAILSATTLSNQAKIDAEAASNAYAEALKDALIDGEISDLEAATLANLLEAKSYAETKAAEAQAAAISIASADASTKLTEAKLYVEGKSYTTGKLLNRDPDFAIGNNGISVYNNAGNTNVIIDRLASGDSPALAVPTTSGYYIRIKNIGAASPDLGGFYFGTQSRANAKFVARIVANIPVGHSIKYAANAYGVGGSQHWVTPTAGTGTWQEYISVSQCGSDGTFSSINYFYIDGAENMEWYVASAAVYDVTQSEVDYIADYTAKVDAASVILQAYTNSQIAISAGETLQDAYDDATAKANAAKAAAEAASATYADTVSNSAASAAQIAAAADASAKANQAYTDALAASNTALNTFANTLKALAYEDVVEIAKLGSTVIDGGYLKNTLIDTVYLKAAIINASQIVIDGGGATTAYANSVAATAQANAISTSSSDASSKAATAESNAIAAAILKDKIVPVAGGKIFNNVYSISSDPVNAALVIHTNIKYVGSYMNDIRIKGYNYVTGSSDIDLTISFYSYDVSSLFHSYGFSSKGSYVIDRVRLAYNASTNAVSIIIGNDSQGWSYPKLTVEKWTATYQVPPDYLGDGWTGSFTNDFTGLTDFLDIPATIAESTAGSQAKANNAQNAAIASANSTALGYAQSYANIAEGNAINSAANTAQAKADAAYTNAVNASNAYAVTQASAYASQAEINAAADASNKANTAYTNAVNAAASAQASLVSTLKSLAYQDIVEISKLGSTIIQGGMIKTDLLNADYIKSSIVNSTYVNTLSLDAGIITSGLISADRIDVANLVATNIAATTGTIGPLNIAYSNLWLGNENTWTANESVVSLNASYHLFRENGSISGQVREVAFNLNSALAGENYTAYKIENSIQNLSPSPTYWKNTNFGVIVDVANADINTGVWVKNGSVVVDNGDVNVVKNVVISGNTTLSGTTMSAGQNVKMTYVNLTSASYTVTVNDYQLIVTDTFGTNRAVVLPYSSIPEGKIIKIYNDVNTSIRIDAVDSSVKLRQGGSNKSLPFLLSSGAAVDLVFNASSRYWYIVGQ